MNTSEKWEEYKNPVGSDAGVYSEWVKNSPQYLLTFMNPMAVPVRLNDQSLRLHGKIGDREQSS